MVANYVLNGTQTLNNGNIVSGGTELFLNAFGSDTTATSTSGLNITSIIGVSGNTGFGVTKTGPETVVLNPAGLNLYTGRTTINQGILLFNSTNALPAASTVVVNSCTRRQPLTRQPSRSSVSSVRLRRA